MLIGGRGRIRKKKITPPTPPHPRYFKLIKLVFLFPPNWNLKEKSKWNLELNLDFKIFKFYFRLLCLRKISNRVKSEEKIESKKKERSEWIFISIYLFIFKLCLESKQKTLEQQNMKPVWNNSKRWGAEKMYTFCISIRPVMSLVVDYSWLTTFTLGLEWCFFFFF